MDLTCPRSPGRSSPGLTGQTQTNVLHLELMEYPQDAVSRHVLNSPTSPQSWALAAVVEGRLVELQRWEGDRCVASEPGPNSALLQLGTTDHRLVVYTKKLVWEWNPTDGALLERSYEKAEGRGIKDLFRPVPGEPQFRGASDWCVVIIDGDVKACHPGELYERARRRWAGLPPSRRSSLLLSPAVESFGGHLWGALRLLKYVAAVASVTVPFLWFALTKGWM